jgi:hypothetical protein
VPQEILDWRPDTFPAADSLAVKTVAAQAGIRAPYWLARPLSFVVGCPKLRVVSDTIVEGDRRFWTELWVYRAGRDTGGHRCPIHREARDTLWYAEHWLASSAGRAEESEWRIHDGPWHVDVRLDRGVTYEDATTIVRAVRHQTLVNRIPAVLRGSSGDTLPPLDADAIQSITTVIARNEGTYKVTIGAWAGYVLYLSIVDGKVLLHNIGSHVS